MKIIVIAVLSLAVSASTFAGFTCVPESYGKATLMTTGERFVSGLSVEDFQKAIIDST